MAAVLSGNTRIIAMLMVGVLVGLGGGFFVLSRMLGGGGSAAPAPPVVVVKKEFEGPAVPLKERVFNLADPNARRYVKLAMSLQFTAEDDKYAKAHGPEKKKIVDELLAELGPNVELIHDTLTTVVSSKTMAQLLTTEGKDQLKQELMGKLNGALPHEFHIQKIYFTDFVVQ